MGKPNPPAPSPAEDWNFKMCKKIAQLTKVIYTLNCRTEDNEERTQWLIAQHQEEMRQMEEDYASRLQAANENVKKADAAKEAAIKELEGVHQTLVKEAQESFRSKLTGLIAKMEEAEKAYAASVKDMQENQVASLQSEMKELREKKDLETENLVKEYNDKYKAMLAQQLDEKDELEKQLNATWGEKVKNLEEQIARLQSDSKSQLDSKSKGLQDLMNQNANLLKEKSTLQEELTAAQSKIASTQKELDELQSKLSAEMSNLGATKDAEQQLQALVAQLQAQLQEKTSALEKALEELNSMNQQAEKLRSNTVAADNELSLIQTEKKSLENQLEQCHQQIAELQAKIQELQERLSSESSNAAGQQSALKELQDKLQHTQAELEQQKDHHQRAAAEWDAKMKDQSSSHEAALRDAQLAHERDLDELRKNAAQEGELAHDKVDQERQALRDAHAAALKEAQDRHAAELAAAHASAGTMEESLRAKLDQLEQANAALQDKLKSETAAREALEAQLQTLTQQVSSLALSGNAQAEKDAQCIAQQKELIATQKARIEELEEEAKNLEAELNKATEQVDALSRRDANNDAAMKNYEKQLKAATDDQRSRIDHLNKEHLQNLQALRHELEEKLRLSEQSASTKLQEERDMHKKQLDNITMSASVIEKQLREALEQLQHELSDSKISSMSEGSKKAEEIAALNRTIAALQTDMEKLRGDHTDALAAQKAACEEDQKRALAKEQAKHAKEMEALADRLQEEFNTQMDAYKSSMDDLLRGEERRHNEAINGFQEKLLSEKQDAIDRLTAGHAAEMKETKSKTEEALRTLQKKHDEVLDTLHTTKTELMQASQERDALRGDLEQMRATLERERKEASDAALNTANTHKATVKQLMDEHNFQVNKLTSEHRATVDNLTHQQESERNSHDVLVGQLRSQLQTLQHKYDYRESRPEDVELINRLMKDNKAKEQQLEKMYNDMKTYKLELINREENYNKVFGRRPNVETTETNFATGTTISTHPSSAPPSERIGPSNSLPPIKTKATKRTSAH